MTIQLRDYQEDALLALQSAIAAGEARPLIEAPTGAGKSVILAAIVARWREAVPSRRFLVLTHTKELVEQDYRALRRWGLSEDEVGVYSAGLSMRDTHQPVIVGGIQSCVRAVEKLGPRSVVIIDEAHRLPRTGLGQYRTLLELMKPEFVVGLTATPYRLDGGSLVTGEDAPFSRIVYTIQMRRLIDAGHLSPLRPVKVDDSFDSSKLKILAGEFRMDDAVLSEHEILERIIDSWLRRARRDDGSLRQTLVFCASIMQMDVVQGMIEERGIACASVCASTPDAPAEDTIFGEDADDEPATRREIIEAFKAGRITALLNRDVLTTGFDAANIECILCLRPTASASLYVQMMGRGTRVHPSKKDCLVLDHAHNVVRHGPVDNVFQQRPIGSNADARTTVRAIECDGCSTLYAVEEPACPYCGLVKPVKERKLAAGLTGDPAVDALLESGDAKRRETYDTQFFRHVSAAGNVTLRISHTTRGGRVDEYLAFDSQKQFARGMAAKTWRARFPGAPAVPTSVDEALELLGGIPNHALPKEVITRMENGWPRVLDWVRRPRGEEPETAPAPEPDLFPYLPHEMQGFSLGFEPAPTAKIGPDDDWMRDPDIWWKLDTPF